MAGVVVEKINNRRGYYERTPEIRMASGIRSKARWSNPEFKAKMSQAFKGKTGPKKGFIPWNKGKKVSKDLFPNYGNRNKKSSEETKKKLSDARKGKKHWWSTGKIGKDNHLWRGGITPLRFAIRGLERYDNWKFYICKRDKHRCVFCGERGEEVDHIIKFSTIFKDFLKHHKDMCPIKDKDILTLMANEYEPFWDFNNGRLLCKPCHRKITFKKYANSEIGK